MKAAFHILAIEGLDGRLILVALALISWTFWKRYSPFYQGDSAASQPLRASPPANMEEYLENLLRFPTTRKKLLKYDFFCRIYKVRLENGEIITIKKAKPLSPLFHIALNFLQRAFWSAVRKNTRNSQVASSVEGASHARLYLEVCRHKTRCLGLHILISNAIQSYVDADRHAMKPKDQTELALAVARAVGYLHSKKIPMLDLNWEDESFIKHLQEIGSVLPYQMFPATLTLRRQDGPMIIRIDIKGLIESAPHKARFHISSARFRASERLREARLHVSQRIKSLTMEEDPVYSDWSEFFSPSSSKTPTNPQLTLFSDAPSPTFDPLSSPVGGARQDEVANLLEYKTNLFEQDRNVCARFVTILACQPNRSVQVALRDPIVSIASAFMKRVDKKGMVDSWDLLEIHVLAAKNGIRAEVFDANPGLRDFLAVNHLHRYLLVFEHELHINKESLECSIVCQGEPVPWKLIPSIIHTHPNTLTITGRYSRHGLVNQGFYDWKKLEPFYLCTATWGNRYLLEINSWIIDTPRMGGDHTWLRLKTPNGECYSVGQYRPQKMSFHEQFVFPMKIKPSKFMSPDVSEFWRGPYRVLAFEITEQEFRRMKKQIEHDQKHREYTYQLFHGNCTRYAKSIAEIANIELPASVPLIKVLVTSERIHALARSILNSSYTPYWVRPFLTTCWAVCFNTFGLFFGSGIVDKEIKHDPIYRDVRPFINDLYDLMDSDKVIAHHPFIIGNFVRNDVLAWRNEQSEPLRKELQTDLERLRLLEDTGGARVDAVDNEEIAALRRRIDDIGAQLQSIKYACPPKYRRRTNAESTLKSNCWVGKTRITEADIDIDDASSTNSSGTTSSDNTL